MNKLDISEETTDELLIELVMGTITYFQKNHAKTSIEDLIKNIASKGGTTEAGLNYLKKNKVDKLFENVIITAENKSTA